MIIHKEQVDTILPNGQPGKKLIVSYVDKEGNVKFLQYPIPEEQMFEWKYTNRANADPPFQEYDFEKKQFKFDANGKPIMRRWMSYDNKFVKRYPVKKLPELRINEILNSFGHAVDPLFEMNIPNTW